VAESPTFDWICSELERRTDLDRLEARGTIRLALKEAGLQARSVTPEQMKVVLERMLPGELATRGVDDAESLCTALLPDLQAIASDPGGGPEAPEDVFRRLGGGA
jgi:hypothetical protein